jgi:hypothetical protein
LEEVISSDKGFLFFAYCVEWDLGTMGVILVINQLSCSLQIESLSVTFHGHDLIVDSELELNYGRFGYSYLIGACVIELHIEKEIHSIFFPIDTSFCTSDDMDYLV